MKMANDGYFHITFEKKNHYLFLSYVADIFSQIVKPFHMVSLLYIYRNMNISLKESYI